MKKLSFLFTLIIVLSISAFAGDDGNTPSGGRTCPNNQTTCLVGGMPDDPIEKQDQDSDSSFNKFYLYLIEMFD